MHLENAVLYEIVAKASSISERIRGGFVADSEQKFAEVINERIDVWMKALTGDDKANFVERLQLDGVDLQSIRPLLGRVSLPETKQIPKWATTLKQVLAACDIVLEKIESGQVQEYRFLDPGKPHSLDRVFLPFIHVGKERLMRRAGSDYAILLPDAQVAFERDLLNILTKVSSSVIELEFSAFCTCRDSVFGPSDGRIEKDEFIEEMLSRNLKKLMVEYSALARILAVCVEQWVESTAEFVTRLTSDLDEIQNKFEWRIHPGKVAALKTGMSDRHHDGRTVVVATFESGERLVYKPRTLGLDEAFSTLVAWLNQHDLHLDLKTVRVIDKQAYGWAEFVEERERHSLEESRLYHNRLGMLMCLFYALYGTDAHTSNLIADGEYPFVIDLETLLHAGVVSEQNGSGAHVMAGKLVYQSVLSTGMLPLWQVGPLGEGIDISAIGSNGEANIRWVSENKGGAKPASDNQNGKPVNMIDDIVDGFGKMYSFLIEHRKTLLAPDSPLVKFEGHSGRFVFRGTEIYSSILDLSLKPTLLKNGADRSIHFDRLSKAFIPVKTGTSEEYWPILRAEFEALERMDVPYFVSFTDSRSLPLASGKEIPDFFSGPSYQMVRSRLESLDENDLKRQVGFIRGSLTPNITHMFGGDRRKSEKQVHVSESCIPNREDLCRIAVDLAGEIRDASIACEDGTMTWIAPCFSPRIQRYQFRQLAPGLYDGAAGIAVFFAALFNFTRAEEFRNVALAALRMTRDALHQEQLRHELIKLIGFHGAMGCSSIVYALARCSQFLDDPALLADAKEAATLITEKGIEGDDDLDVIFGVAGTITALIALYEATPDAMVLQKAIKCGEHLMAKRITSLSGHHIWKTKVGLATGFSHGAAGIANALLRLSTVSGKKQFKQAACDAIAFEQEAFDHTIKNWPRQPEVEDAVEPRAWCSWCHGAPGIGLARVATLDILDSPKIREDISYALETTQTSETHDTDNVCCGNMGRIEFFVTAAQKLGDTRLQELALQKTGQVIARAQSNGGFALEQWEGGPINPSFFQGGAGFGYGLLRLAYPDDLPSVLAWE